MISCKSCGRRKEPSQFLHNRRACRACYAEQSRERRTRKRAEWLVALTAADRERYETWRNRVEAQVDAANELRRRHGWPELSAPDLEPGWLERLQERVREKTR